MDSVGGDVESGKKIDREPQMHIKADLNKENLVCILASTVLSYRVFLVSRPRERPGSCRKIRKCSLP